MKRVFVYAPLIRKRLDELENPDNKARQIENEILKNPETGDIVAGTGGVRKFRLSDEARGKGKRGGIRVFYLDLPHTEKTYLLFLLKKGEAADLTGLEKAMIRELVSALKKESRL